MGWKELDELENNKEEISPKIKELAELTYEVFEGNNLGKKLLEKLKEFYFYTPVAPHSMSSNYAYFREGENNVIRTFENLIFIHKMKEEKKA